MLANANVWLRPRWKMYFNTCHRRHSPGRLPRTSTRRHQPRSFVPRTKLFHCCYLEILFELFNNSWTWSFAFFVNHPCLSDNNRAICTKRFLIILLCALHLQFIVYMFVTIITIITIFHCNWEVFWIVNTSEKALIG